MDSSMKSGMIPGTVFDREKMGGVTGEEFLSKIFYITDGIMLGQIREITGMDGTTLQNWVKRGWLTSPVNKLYNKEQLARILIISLMRDTVQLSRIIFLLRYINGRLDDASDDIISDSKLYDYICKIIDLLMEQGSQGLEGLPDLVRTATSGYEEKYPGAKKRLDRALEIIILSCWASLLKARADRMLDALEAN